MSSFVGNWSNVVVFILHLPKETKIISERCINETNITPQIFQCHLMLVIGLIRAGYSNSSPSSVCVPCTGSSAVARV